MNTHGHDYGVENQLDFTRLSVSSSASEAACLGEPDLMDVEDVHSPVPIEASWNPKHHLEPRGDKNYACDRGTVLGSLVAINEVLREEFDEILIRNYSGKLFVRLPQCIQLTGDQNCTLPYPLSQQVLQIPSFPHFRCLN